MQDVHSIAAAVRAANARNVARGGRQLPIRKIITAVTGISGFVLAMGIEQNLWFALRRRRAVGSHAGAAGKKMTPQAATREAKKEKYLTAQL